jgi:hypothetical protein
MRWVWSLFACGDAAQARPEGQVRSEQSAPVHAATSLERPNSDSRRLKHAQLSFGSDWHVPCPLHALGQNAYVLAKHNATDAMKRTFMLIVFGLCIEMVVFFVFISDHE